MKCHYVTEPDGNRYLMPGCEPGWYNDAHCICRMPSPRTPPHPKDALVLELEKENARLNRLLSNILKRRPGAKPKKY